MLSMWWLREEKHCILKTQMKNKQGPVCRFIRYDHGVGVPTTSQLITTMWWIHPGALVLFKAELIDILFWFFRIS